MWIIDFVSFAKEADSKEFINSLDLIEWLFIDKMRRDSCGAMDFIICGRIARIQRMYSRIAGIEIRFCVICVMSEI